MNGKYQIININYYCQRSVIIVINKSECTYNYLLNLMPQTAYYVIYFRAMQKREPWKTAFTFKIYFEIII